MARRIKGMPTGPDFGIAELVHKLTGAPGSCDSISGWVIGREVNRPDTLTVTFVVDSPELDDALAHLPEEG